MRTLQSSGMGGTGNIPMSLVSPRDSTPFGFHSQSPHTGRAVLSTTRRMTKLEWTPLTPSMRVILLSSSAW